MGFRSATNVYAGQDLRTQLMYAEREVVELEKETKKLKEERDWFEFKCEMLDKQLKKYQEKKELSKPKCLDLHIDMGKYYADEHAEQILNSK